MYVNHISNRVYQYKVEIVRRGKIQDTTIVYRWVPCFKFKDANRWGIKRMRKDVSCK